MKILLSNATNLVSGGVMPYAKELLVSLAGIILDLLHYTVDPNDLLVLLSDDLPIISPHYFEERQKKIDIATRIGCTVLGIRASDAPAELAGASVHLFDALKILIETAVNELRKPA